MTPSLPRMVLPAGGAAGLSAIAWVGAGYLSGHPLALAITVLIGVVFVAGMAELWRFDRDSSRLRRALPLVDAPPPALADWLAQVPDALRAAVRLRLDGHRLPLPGPAMTPYLVGLLALLGMLGTFLGMVVTLQGTGLALQQASNLAGMRDSLAAPVKGLGLAFGTSVAGVAASAVLGLMSALSRRQRLRVAQQLDAAIAGPLHGLSRAHRDEAAQARLQAQMQQADDRVHELARQLAGHMHQQSAHMATLLQQQAQWLPALADRLQAAMEQLDAQGRRTGEQLLAGQAHAQQRIEAAFQGLATAVGQALQHSLADGAQRAADTLGPAVQATLDGLAQQAQSLHAQLGAHTRQQVDALAAAVDARAAAWLQSLSERQAAQGQALTAAVGDRLEAAALRLDGAAQALGGAWQAAAERHERQAAERDAQRLAAWLQALEASAARIGAQVEGQARATVAEVARLAHGAAEAPRAAAEVVAQLREQLSDSLARDQALLAERTRVLATLDTLLDAVRHNAGAQKAAIDTLVASTADWLAQASSRFDARAEAQAARLEALAGQLGEGAADVASLGQALVAAVDGFARAGEALTGHLQRLDESLGQAMARSDEQLAYYVAQAREVIDLSLSAQQQIVADLQRVAAGRLAPAGA